MLVVVVATVTAPWRRISRRCWQGQSTVNGQQLTVNAHANVIILMLQCGADINKAENFGHVPVSLASKEGKMESVKILVNNGAKLQIRSKKNPKTAIQKVRKYKHKEIMQYLERCGGEGEFWPNPCRDGSDVLL